MSFPVDTTTLGWSSWSAFSSCDENCFKYRQRFCSHTNKALCEGANEYGVQKEIVECIKDATECYGMNKKANHIILALDHCFRCKTNFLLAFTFKSFNVFP